MNNALGSKKRSSIPMTPRSVQVKPTDFARQLADQNDNAQPSKKFKSSAAPKGTKLAAGYHDRTRDRLAETEGSPNDKAVRIKALEEQAKLGQIDKSTFEKLRDDILGGDIESTHLVKGLDRKLLERVRRGEDVLGGGGKDDEEKTLDNEAKEVPAQPKTVDDEFEAFEQKDVAPVERQTIAKKGEMAPPPLPVAGIKRSRNDILAELKASRKAATEAQASSQLGSRFRKFGETKSTAPRVEVDEKGREVLITVDENGRVKRKVRKIAQDEAKSTSTSTSKGLLMPEKSAKPLGMVVPIAARPSQDADEDEDEDIFGGVGTSYDPLGAEQDEDDGNTSSSSSSSGSSSSNEAERRRRGAPERSTKRASRSASLDSSRSSKSSSRLRSRSHSKSPSRSRSTTPIKDQKLAAPQTQQEQEEKKNNRNNYFNDKPASTTTTTESSNPANPLEDPAILASLRRAAGVARKQQEEEDEAAKSKPSARLAAAAARDRDMEDIDMGFGESRFADGEDDDDGPGGKVKLSEWGQEDDEDEEGHRKRGGTNQRKRGKKKKKGDKNSAADVLRVMQERRK